MKKPAGAMLTTGGVVAFWLLWSAAFVLMLWAVSPGRTLQDALAAELLQGHLSGGYQLRNPPLYEWLLWGVQQLAGPGPLSYLILRYCLIAATGILFYVALLRTAANLPLAASFSFSLVLFYWLGWEIHHSVSHTLALLAASPALFITVLAYAERPTAARAFLLGLIIGIGLMAKWSFLLVALSLAVSLAATPQTRRIFREPCTLLVLLGAALPILPFALWLAHVDLDLLVSRTMPSGNGLSRAQALKGAVVFIISLPLVFLPWIAVVLFFAWRFPDTPRSPALFEGTAIRLASLTAITILFLMAAILAAATMSGASLFGITRFAIHYLFPFCLFAAAGARRSHRASRECGAVRAEARAHLARRGSRDLSRQACELACGAGGLGSDQRASLCAARRRAHAARPGRCAIRDAFAARCRQSRHLSP